MGNGPISCCKSKSLRSNGGSFDSGVINSNKNRSEIEDKQQDNQQHILQHISEREPDDSETDPSSNPIDRPIFATRSSKSKTFNNNSLYVTNQHQNNSVYVPTKCDQFVLNPLLGDQKDGCSASSPVTPDDLQMMNLMEGFKFDSYQQKLSTNPDHVETSTIEHYDEPTDNNLIHETIDEVVMNHKLDSVPPLYISQSQYSSLMKVNSCSRIHSDGSTISQPKLKQTIKCVSLAIYFHIRNRTSDDYVEIFDETIYPLKVPKNVDSKEEDKDEKLEDKYVFSDDSDDEGDQGQDLEAEKSILRLDNADDRDRSLCEPDRKTIYNFVKTLFKAAQLSSEYAITTLVYLERLMTYAEMDLTPKTWRRMFLGAILLSSKVWEDQAVWNIDYADILEDISVDDINELERHFLGLIQFNMNVPSSVYAKYYFHLRTLALTNDLSKRYSLMTVKEAKDLEVS